ncbi:MAG: exonuclease domain-containing protein [Myxococcales bacterium]
MTSTGTIWALDLETGGLDPRRDAIIAVGMVPIRDGSICLGEAWQTLVRPEGLVRPASIGAHHIVPSELAGAPALPAVLREIDARLSQAALLVHGAAIDVAFLRRAHKERGLKWPAPEVIDTAELLARAGDRRRFLVPHAPEPELDLRKARRALGLPDYPVHDALSDAIAAAELYLALYYSAPTPR